MREMCEKKGLDQILDRKREKVSEHEKSSTAEVNRKLSSSST